MEEKFVILCCENIRPEVDAILADGSMPDATVQSFPYHRGHVRSVWEPIREQFSELDNAKNSICLIGCGCANRLDIPGNILKKPSLVLVGSGTSLFIPETLAEEYQRRGSHLILPGWLFHWRQNAERDRVDHSTAHQMFRESISELILVDTGAHTGIAPVLAEYAEFTGLPTRTLPVGLDHFRFRLHAEYLKWKYRQETASCQSQIRKAERRVADYSMVADLTGRIIGVHDEKAVIRQMLDIVFLICSPKRTGFLPAGGKTGGEIISIPENAYSSMVHFERVLDPGHPYYVTETLDSFLFHLKYEDLLLGTLSVDHVSLPDSLDEYLNITHFISQIAGLSITIARTHQDLVQTVSERDEEIEGRRKTEDALKAAIKKLNMLSSITRHDILNQVMGLRTFLDLSREDLKGTKFESYVEKEDQAAEAIQRQIEFTRYYQDIGVHAAKWQDADGVIREALGQLNPPGIDVQIAVFGVEVFADPLIVKVFFNLMENSLRHGEKVTTMSFSTHKSEAGFAILYQDNGVGISAEDKTRLFRKGFGKHTGLGLFLSQEILAITGITITENGIPGNGVRFEMMVPDGGYRFRTTDVPAQ